MAYLKRCDQKEDLVRREPEVLMRMFDLYQPKDPPE